MAGYHSREITRGEYGEFSKIVEEYDELLDAAQQFNPIMMINEMADLIGAMEGYVKNKYNLTLHDLLIMKAATEKAFKEGHRTAKTM